MEPTKLALEIWTVFHKPIDYPNKYVVRLFVNQVATNTVFTADTIEEVRQFLPQGLYCMPRNPRDHSTIVECWL